MTSPTTINNVMATLNHNANADLITGEMHDIYQGNRLQRPDLVIALTECALKNADQPLRDHNDQCAVRQIIMGTILLALETELVDSESAVTQEVERFQPQVMPKRSKATIPGAYLAV